MISCENWWRNFVWKFWKMLFLMRKMASRMIFWRFFYANFFMFKLESICSCKVFRELKLHSPKQLVQIPLMSSIEPKYCVISTSYLVELFDIFILLHIWQNCMCFWCLFTNEDTVMLIIRNLNLISIQSWTYLAISALWKTHSCKVILAKLNSKPYDYLYQLLLCQFLYSTS